MPYMKYIETDQWTILFVCQSTYLSHMVHININRHGWMIVWLTTWLTAGKFLPSLSAHLLCWLWPPHPVSDLDFLRSPTPWNKWQPFCANFVFSLELLFGFFFHQWKCMIRSHIYPWANQQRERNGDALILLNNPFDTPWVTGEWIEMS